MVISHSKLLVYQKYPEVNNGDINIFEDTGLTTNLDVQNPWFSGKWPTSMVLFQHLFVGWNGGYLKTNKRDLECAGRFADPVRWHHPPKLAWSDVFLFGAPTMGCCKPLKLGSLDLGIIYQLVSWALPISTLIWGLLVKGFLNQQTSHRMGPPR